MENHDEEICSDCNGSGEGMYEGTRCITCHGSGVSNYDDEDDPFEGDRDEKEI